MRCHAMPRMRVRRAMQRRARARGRARDGAAAACAGGAAAGRCHTADALVGRRHRPVFPRCCRRRGGRRRRHRRRRAWRSRCLSAPARSCRCARQRRQERAAWAMATAGRSSVGRARRAAQPPVRGIARARQKAGERTTAPARARRTQVALCRGGTSLALPLAPPSLPAVVRAENDVDAGLSRAPTKRLQSPSGRTCARCASASCAPTSLPRCWCSWRPPARRAVESHR